MSAGNALLRALPPITFVVGKGGVGKTTCAAALALRASRSADTLLVSTDPARALPSVLAHSVGSEPGPVSYAPALQARMLEASSLREHFMSEWRDVLAVILDRGTYLDDADIAPMVDTALPGGDEIFAALELARLFAERREPTAHRRIVIDTAPTGHTLRLLALPRTFRALVRLLDAMQDKHRFMVRTLTRAYRRDRADEFLAEMQGYADTLDATFRDHDRCGALLVTNAQPVVEAESRRYLEHLDTLGVRVAGAVWNGETAPGDLPVVSRYVVPRLPDPPVGESGLERWMDALATAPPRRSRPTARRESRAAGVGGGAAPLDADWLTPLTIVAGKGGVGKTTVACALALVSAERSRTLVVSTDPAPSLADALAQAIPDADTPVAGMQRLSARQMDATAAFGRLRDEYAARVDALFANLMGRGMNLERDHAIARDLLALAPPGVDEVYALTLLSDALFADRYERVIVDPAPTGHLLRMLEMPQLALAWTHQLMRLMLRYKDVAGLGESARDLLEFAKNLRLLDALLRDPARCGIVLVTLDEPVVREESERLAAAAAGLGVVVRAVVHNRADAASLPVGRVAMQVVAPAENEPLVGADAIRRWTSGWTRSAPLRGATSRTR